MRFVLAIGSVCVCAYASAAAGYAQDASPEPTATALATSAPSLGPSLVERVGIDPAEIVRARVGQTFALALRSNRTTGFSWHLAEPPGAPVQAVGSAYEDRSANIGGGGQEFWLFRAVAPGDAMVKLIYVRPSDKGSPLMERAVTFRVNVVP